MRLTQPITRLKQIAHVQASRVAESRGRTGGGEGGSGEEGFGEGETGYAQLPVILCKKEKRKSTVRQKTTGTALPVACVVMFRCDLIASVCPVHRSYLPVCALRVAQRIEPLLQRNHPPNQEATKREGGEEASER